MSGLMMAIGFVLFHGALGALEQDAYLAALITGALAAALFYGGLEVKRWQTK